VSNLSPLPTAAEVFAEMDAEIGVEVRTRLLVTGVAPGSEFLEDLSEAPRR
jgi:hypothetical protein